MVRHTLKISYYLLKDLQIVIIFCGEFFHSQLKLLTEYLEKLEQIASQLQP